MKREEVEAAAAEDDSSSDDDKWDMEREGLVLEGEDARHRMVEAGAWAAEKGLTSVRAQEETEEAKKEAKENYKQVSEKIFDQFEELAKKKENN